MLGPWVYEPEEVVRPSLLLCRSSCVACASLPKRVPRVCVDAYVGLSLERLEDVSRARVRMVAWVKVRNFLERFFLDYDLLFYMAVAMLVVKNQDAIGKAARLPL